MKLPWVAALLMAAVAAHAATNELAAPAALTATNEMTNAVTKLKEVVVTGRADSLVGLAESATQGTTGQAQLADRPILRSGELLETVPGVIITQHAGGGKANQYYCRGFNLDHGTDFAVFLDNMPLNLPTHAHGQGYCDMNIVIPEFVQRLNYQKGPYYADVGDFGSVGAAHLDFYQSLPQDFVTLEAGSYGYERGVFGVSQKAGQGTLLYGGEAYHDDGPWTHPDDYWKYNGLLTYSQGDAADGFSITAHGYHGEWDSSDQIPQSFARTNWFGAINPTDGGHSQRYSLQAEWHRSGGSSETKVTAYAFYYDLDLFSDFTGFLVDTNKGDQFEQKDRRWVEGLDARHTLFSEWFGHDVQNTFGLQIRNDWINNGVYQTENRVRTSKINVDPDTGSIGEIIPEIMKQDTIIQTEIGPYFENKAQWADKFRTEVGLRYDLFNFHVADLDPANSGDVTDGLLSPKLNLTFGPWEQTEFYIQGGYGFHSDDARATTTTTNLDGSTVGGRAAGLIQTRGAEIGIRTLAIPNLQSTVSFWYLHSNSELLMDGDTGDTVASPQPSNRYGVEWANYYALAKNLALDLDAADSVAKFTELDTTDVGPGSSGGYYVPEAVGVVVSSGVTLHDLEGFSASLRLRYFGPRNLTADGAYKSTQTVIVNAEAGYQINKTWRITAEILNLLNRRDQDIAYAYESRVSPTAAPEFQVHLHPDEPIQFRAGLTARF